MTSPAFEPDAMKLNQIAQGVPAIHWINDWRNDCYLSSQSEQE